MPLEITLTENNKVRINPQYPVVAGIDDLAVPHIIRTDANGRLDLGAVAIPPFDAVVIAYIGTTNNIATGIYTLVNVEQARWTFTYLGGGVSNDDLITSAAFTVP